MSLTENNFGIASLNYYYSCSKIVYLVRNTRVDEAPVQSPSLLLLVGAYRNRNVSDFSSSLLPVSLGKVTALHWDLTVAAAVWHYTFVSHGSVTLALGLKN